MLAMQGLSIDEITYNIDHGHGRPVRVLYKFAHLARYAGRKPRQTLSLWAKVAATRQKTTIDLAKEALNCMFIVSLASRSRPDGNITLLDQGMAQALWSVGFAARHDPWLELVLGGFEEAMVRPDILVHVRAGLHTIRERLSRRSPHVSRLEHALGSDDQPLRIAEANSTAVLSKFEARGIVIIEVANDHPEQLTSNAELVTNTILSKL